jgi:hypothetical protein
MSLLDHLSLVNHTSAFKAASAHATLMPLATFLQRAEESGKTFSWAMGAAMDALHRHIGRRYSGQLLPQQLPNASLTFKGAAKQLQRLEPSFFSLSTPL